MSLPDYLYLCLCPPLSTFISIFIWHYLYRSQPQQSLLCLVLSSYSALLCSVTQAVPQQLPQLLAINTTHWPPCTGHLQHWDRRQHRSKIHPAPCYALWCYVMSCTTCYCSLCYIMPSNVMICQIMLPHVLSCYSLECHVLLLCVLWWSDPRWC